MSSVKVRGLNLSTFQKILTLDEPCVLIINITKRTIQTWKKSDTNMENDNPKEIGFLNSDKDANNDKNNKIGIIEAITIQSNAFNT